MKNGGSYFPEPAPPSRVPPACQNIDEPDSSFFALYEQTYGDKSPQTHPLSYQSKEQFEEEQISDGNDEILNTMEKLDIHGYKPKNPVVASNTPSTGPRSQHNPDVPLQREFQQAANNWRSNNPFLNPYPSPDDGDSPLQHTSTSNFHTTNMNSNNYNSTNIQNSHNDNSTTITKISKSVSSFHLESMS